MRLGGPTVTRALAGGTERLGLFCVTTTTIDTGIGTALALQCACMQEDDGYAHGLATAALLEHDLLVESLDCSQGVMVLPRLPGLGVELDERAVKKYVGPWQEAY
jgi:L-alanine-DL-glutamate epimerase-like enolase superfamily enzyme